MNIVTLQVTCASDKEASDITTTILNKKLAACVKSQSISSNFWWNGAIENSHEILLIIETIADKFDEIEHTIKELHSYETFVLMEYPVSRASAGVEAWLNENVATKK